MIKSPQLLVELIQEYLRSTLIVHRKDGVVVHLDGTLMSIANCLLLKELPIIKKYILCTSTTNRIYTTHILSLAKMLEVSLELIECAPEFKANTRDEIATKKRLVDYHLYASADATNLAILSNLCYSQWCIEFPHKAYQNRDHIHLLNRLFFSEVKQLCSYFKLPDSITQREPSHYLYPSKVDKDFLGFNYDALEEFLRNKQIKSTEDRLISELLVPDNRSSFICPLISRPSNVLG